MVITFKNQFKTDSFRCQYFTQIGISLVFTGREKAKLRYNSFWIYFKIGLKNVDFPRLFRLNFSLPNQVKDWDDRMTQVKWINEVVVHHSAPDPAAQPPQPLANPLASSQNHFTSMRASVVLNTNREKEKEREKEAAAAAAAAAQVVVTKQIVKKKVVEVEPEPKHSRLDESVPPLELLVSANSDFCRYRCRVNAIRLKDTLMFQTRVFELVDFVC